MRHSQNFVCIWSFLASSYAFHLLKIFEFLIKREARKKLRIISKLHVFFLFVILGGCWQWNNKCGIQKHCWCFFCVSRHYFSLWFVKQFFSVKKYFNSTNWADIKRLKNTQTWEVTEFNLTYQSIEIFCSCYASAYGIICNREKFSHA